MDFTFSLERFLVQTNFTAISSIVVLIAFIKTNVSFSDRINRFFLLSCSLALILTISDNTRFITAHLDQPNIFRYISAGVGYAIRPSIIYILAIIAGRHEKKINLLIIIPLYFCILVSIMSIFPFSKGIMFSFSQTNDFVRGPLGFLSHITCGIYSVFIIYFSIRNLKYNRYELIVVVFILLAGITAAFLENKFKFDFILSQVIVAGIIFYYLYLCVQTYKRDTLTNLMNRRCFYLELNHLLKNDLILLSMDLNNLKHYNDTLGHSAGDRALVTTTKYMLSHFSKDAKIYRTGGDEFMAIFTGKDELFVKNLVEDFQKDLNNTEYRVACGVAKYSSGDDIEKIITLSDERMYSDKVKIKNQEAFKTLE